MYDDKDQISHEEEYQFPEDEFIQGESTGRPSIEADPELEAAAKGSQREKILKIAQRIREILANRVIASIIAVIILLFFVHWFMSGTSKKPVQQPVVTQSTPTTVQTATPSPEVMNQLSGIKQSATSMHDTVASLQNQVQQLQASVTAMTQNHQQYDSAIIQLSQKINAMAANEKKLLAQATTKNVVKSKAPAIVIPPVTFFTRAVIHNRAWVEGDNGVNVSITVGDHLKDYGKIMSINTNTGIIKTSSGRTIRYAPSDH